MHNMEKVVSHFGKKSNLARALGVSQSSLSIWISWGFFPPRRAIEIERLTGGLFKAIDIPTAQGEGEGDSDDAKAS